MKPMLADIHMHTIASGHAFGTMREMAAEAAARGMQLIGFSEHAPGIPGTCDPIYFRNFIDAPRQLYGMQIIHGSEVNILADGQLSLDQRHLDCLDYAIAGIHGFCYQNEGIVKNTDNVIKCMANSKVRLISHPDNSLYPLDYPTLVAGAKAYNTALEVNNSSLRNTALRPGCYENYKIMLPLCMEHGVSVAVNSDAHDPCLVADMYLALSLLEEIGFDESLILNNDIRKLKAFLLEV